MMKLGIALIGVAVIAPAVAMVSAVFGLYSLTSMASWTYFASPALLALGIVLVVLGAMKRGPRGAAR